MYSFDSRVRFSETDREGKLALQSIVDYFQDCSTFQSEDLGVGIQTLKERKLVWVLSYWQIVIDEYPGLGEYITVATHPHELRGFMGLRNYCLQDKNKNILVKANSLWTLLNKETARPSRIPEDIQAKYILEEKLPMDYAPRKVAIMGEETVFEPMTIDRHHLDCNGHVNNGQYIRIASAFLKEDKRIKQLRAEYKMQAYLGTTIYPYCYVNGEKTIISLCDDAKNPYTIIEFIFDKKY